MAEYLVVEQNSNFETEFRANDPHNPESDEIRPVLRVHELPPDTQLRGSLGACTAIVLNTCAQQHKLDLQKVELQLSYDRIFQDNGENCGEIEHGRDRLTKS